MRTSYWRTGVLLVFLFGAQVRAELAASAGPSIGATMGGDIERATFLWGGQAEVRVSDSLRIELSLLSLEDRDEEERLGVSMSADVGIRPFALTGRYVFPPVGTLRPYLLAGVAWYWYDDVPIRIHSDPAVPDSLNWKNAEAQIDGALGEHAGVGLEWPLAARWRIFGEYRMAHVAPHASVAGMPAGTAESEYVRDEIRHDFEDKYWIGLLRLGVSGQF